jgi:hypothetical protein
VVTPVDKGIVVIVIALSPLWGLVLLGLIRLVV